MRAGLAALCAALLTGAAAATPASVLQTLDRAEVLSHDEHAQPVTLPDTAEIEDGQPGPLQRRYRWSFELDSAANDQGLYFSGLQAHARISVNGLTLVDTLDDAALPVPRSVDQVVLLPVPEAYWSAGVNQIELEAAAPRALSVSPLIVGPTARLSELRRARIIGTVIGPAFVATVMGTLGVFTLLLGSRRRDSLYGLFGAGALTWSLHSAWTISPWRLLPGEHLMIWWNAMYALFVSLLVVSCLRFVGRRWPRFERAIWLGTLAGPALLYAASGMGQLSLVTDVWRLGILAVVSIATAIIAHAAWNQRSAQTTLIALVGGAAFAFGTHDWIVTSAGLDNNPVYLAPYAGLFLVVFVVYMLVARFVLAARDLETANAELEHRVEARSRELHAAMQQMSAARNAAESADQAKTRFLAAASHDLRQPVHALGLYVAALRAESLAAGPGELVQRIGTTLNALDQMFDTLLDISRIDAGAVVPQQRRFALGPMLRNLADEFAPQCELRGLRLALHLPARPPPPESRSDAALVERILRNLLANAVKYTAEGGVLLACRARAGCWSVEIWDTGIGIDREDRERVFEEFVQLGNPGRQRAQGLGLGLAIVRRLVGLLGLTLQLDSQPGRGTRFVLRLPRIAPAASHAARPSTAVRVAAPLDGLCVALIEDDAEVRDAMGLLLQRWGCGVVAGADAAQVLARSDLGMPASAVIADYRLGGSRTGLQEAAVLRRRWGTLPVLIVTGDASAPMLRELGASGYPCLHKPVAPDLLRRWLEELPPRSLRSLPPGGARAAGRQSRTRARPGVAASRVSRVPHRRGEH